jgi:tRNA uridine 5-carboxymethylaminomethyl modification enzyme
MARLPRYETEVEDELEAEAAYAGYVGRQQEEVARLRALEAAELPVDLSYADVNGLSSEAREKLDSVRPRSLGQAGRISGITPAAVSALAVHLKKKHRR